MKIDRTQLCPLGCRCAEAADEIERLLAQNLRFAKAIEIGEEAFPNEAWDAVLNEATSVCQQNSSSMEKK